MSRKKKFNINYIVLIKYNFNLVKNINNRVD